MKTKAVPQLLLLALCLSGFHSLMGQFTTDASQSSRPDGTSSPAVQTSTLDVTAGNEHVVQEATSKDKDNFNPAILQSLDRDLDAVENEFEEYEDEKTKLLAVRIFSRGNDRGLDFENHHNEMLGVFTDTAKLLNNLQLISGRSTAVLAQLAPIKGNGILPDQVTKLEQLKKKSAGLQALIDKTISDVSAYRSELNNQLIEDVHRYQIKNSFRSQVGIVWLVCFLAICAGLIYLLKIGVLSARESSTLQLVAMILIVFVIVLFGIADVMGENGVTGLLAALAGYILGKSSTGTPDSGSSLADIIAAAQGRNNPKPPPSVTPPSSPETE